MRRFWTRAEVENCEENKPGANMLTPQRDWELRVRLNYYKQMVTEIEAELSAANQPAYVDAKQILADLDAREKSKRRIPSVSQETLDRRAARLDDQLYRDAVIVDEC